MTLKADITTALVAFAAVAIVWWAIAHQNVSPSVSEDSGTTPSYTGASQ